MECCGSRLETELVLPPEFNDAEDGCFARFMVRCTPGTIGGGSVRTASSFAPNSWDSTDSMSWREASKLRLAAEVRRFLRGDACRKRRTMTLMIYRAQLSSRAGGSARVGVAVESCSAEAWRPRAAIGGGSGVVGMELAAGLLPLEFGLVSSGRGPQREAMAKEKTLRRKSCD